jgi:Mg-chelatase subunit ChlD
VDSILQEGDRLTIWSAGEKAGIIFQETLGASGKDNIKEKLKTLDTGTASPDFSGALKDAARVRARQSVEGRISYTLLVSGTAGGLGASLSGTELDLIRYSRVEEFKGWRTLVVAPDIEAAVKQSAAAFIAGR